MIRILTHLMTVVVAVTLMVKPCAAALTAQVDAPARDQQSGLVQVDVGKKRPCLSSCLQARLESQRKFEPKAMPSGKALSPADRMSALRLVPGQLQSVIGKNSSRLGMRCRQARILLFHLCRQRL